MVKLLAGKKDTHCLEFNQSVYVKELLFIQVFNSDSSNKDLLTARHGLGTGDAAGSKRLTGSLVPWTSV